MYKVLLADDEALILAGLRRKIDWNALGFEIIGECMDGKKLLNEILAKQPDLLVLDIQMPYMNGLEVLNSIRGIISIPSIVISGFSDFAYAQEAIRCGVIDYLLKPVSPAMLQSAVLKAKQQLDLSGIHKQMDSGLIFHFIRLNIEQMQEEDLLRSLTLSGNKKYYRVIAFNTGFSIRDHMGDEISCARFDEKTSVAIIHSDLLPDDYPMYLNERFSFDGSAGVSDSFTALRGLPVRTDEAVLSLRTAWLKSGVYLWPTENEAASISYFIRQAKRMAEDVHALRRFMELLPEYVLSHRLNVQSVEQIYNTLISYGTHADMKPVQFTRWDEIIGLYAEPKEMMAALCSHLNPESDINSELTSARIVSCVEEILQQNYAQSVTLQGMASRFHIDMSYLSTLFHEHTGKTFTSYLTDIRINHACEYLRTTTLSNAKIAQLCGFADDSYMKKVFRKVINQTPSAYRAANLGENMVTESEESGK